MQFVASRAYSGRSPAGRVLASAALAAVAVLRRLRNLAVSLRHRREAVRLLAVDDYMLRDIGITRFDLTSALAAPLYRDPTADLAGFAAERRAAIRAARERRVRSARDI